MTLLHSPGMRRQLGGHGRGVGGSEAEDEKGGGGGEVGGKGTYRHGPMGRSHARAYRMWRSVQLM